jgi:hypothetical protein
MEKKEEPREKGQRTYVCERHATLEKWEREKLRLGKT